ncbi:hypothetical protein M569_13072, partial [Genlisea aurea]
QIFIFGNAHMDVGNDIRLSYGSNLRSNYYLYGIDNYNKSTGRWSNGLILSDYAAQSSEILPYLVGGSNFAVAGATALNKSTLASYEINSLDVPNISMQLEWFYTYASTSLSTRGDVELYYIFGPLGGSDIIYAITQCNKTYNEISNMIPVIAESIFTSVNQV